MRDVVVTIPAFEPDEALTGLVRGLRMSFRTFVIVNDGSRRPCPPLDELRRTDGVIVLDHSENRGKGAALKTAFAEVLNRFPDAAGVVTVDADGQHLAEDVVRVSDALIASTDRLVLGVRTFGRDIPFRSKLGNLWTIAEFRLLTGNTVHDTQSGLRGIPLSLLARLANLPGERYEYEIRMLVTAALSSGGIAEVPIRTVYLDGNKSSHFRPLADTYRTQKALFAAALAARTRSRHS